MQVLKQTARSHVTTENGNTINQLMVVYLRPFKLMDFYANISISKPQEK